ncbi:hypothetical protein F2P79_023216 [Pimephales promelas]|nr:hypothetical protein F2P79_023216 [Pimephales promelas]
MHPGEQGLTWFSGDGTKASRIDYIFTQELLPVDAKLTPVFFSDHAMLSCTLSFPTGVTTGKGLWRLNCSLLEDTDIVEEYREQYRQWKTLKDFYDSHAQWWEMVKGKTKTYFKRAGKKKKDKERRCMVGLQKRLQRYFNLLNQGFDFNEDIRQVKKTMADLEEKRNKGVILQSREKELEEGEKCTSYFFRKIVNRGVGEVIHPDQTCAVPGRKITDSLILMRDTICFARDRNIRLAVLNLDFEKAFDRVSHQYLFQGCPLSPLLYAVCIEPLAQALRKDKWIRGLTIPGTGGLTAKTVLYMDDVNLLCTDILSIHRTMDLTDWFGRAWFLQAVDREIFRFLWGGKWERLKREEMKKAPKNGGKGEREQVSPVHGLSLSEAKTVWQNVSHPALRNGHRDLAWMAAHEILPVRAVMHSRGMARISTCPQPGCGATKTVRHALWECSAVRDLWATAGPLQFPYLPAGGVPDYWTTVGLVSQEPAENYIKRWLTMNCIKDAIWTSRNLLVGKRMQVSLHAIKELAIYRLQEYTACRHSDVGTRAPQEKGPLGHEP